MVPTVIIKVAAALQVNSVKSDKSHLSLSEGKGVSQPRTALLSVSSERLLYDTWKIQGRRNRSHSVPHSAVRSTVRKSSQKGARHMPDGGISSGG